MSPRELFGYGSGASTDYTGDISYAVAGKIAKHYNLFFSFWQFYHSSQEPLFAYIKLAVRILQTNGNR